MPKDICSSANQELQMDCFSAFDSQQNQAYQETF